MGKAREEISRVAKAKDGGTGEGLRVISVADVVRISERCGLTRRDVEIAALEAGVVPARYARNMGTIGPEGQLKLLRSRVLVAGAGGLGGAVVELLARVGTGNIVVVDRDSFEDDNLNRQLLCTENNLGRPKAAEAVKRAAEVNSSSVVEGVTAELAEENLGELLAGAAVAVDCLDNFPARRMLEAACRRAGVPLVHGAIAGFVGQVMTVFPEDVGVSGLYGSPDAMPARGIEAILGNPSATPAMVAAWQVQEVVKVITGRGSPLRNRLLFLDAESGQVELLRLDPAPARS